MEEYTQVMWNEDKMLIAKLISKGKKKEAYELTSDIFMIVNIDSISRYISGILFAFDILKVNK